jgi:uncharacterized membrane protein YbhN (UPF0104 family)
VTRDDPRVLHDQGQPPFDRLDGALSRAPVHGSVRKRWMAAAAALVLALVALAVVRGWDAIGWLRAVLDSFQGISVIYLVPALALKTLQILFAAEAWFRILRYAYPGAGLRRLPVLACYATGVAVNAFVPASAGTLVTMLMLVAVIEPATFAGMLGAAAVEKLFFAVAGIAVFVYLFLSVSGSFTLQFATEARHPWLSALTAAVVVGVVAVAGRLAWRWLGGLWQQAKRGGKIVADGRVYVRHVVVPQLLSWCCGVGGVAVVLLAWGIPVGFHTVMLVVGGNTLAGVASVTPGGVGVSQAVNVASLHGTTSASTASGYSIGQQLLSTAWNVVLAIGLLVAAFGWSGGRRLVADAWIAARRQQPER